MNCTIEKWTASLSNGGSFNQSAKENDLILWPGLHWDQEENRLEKRRIETVTDGDFTTGKVLLKFKDIPFQETMHFAETDALKLFIRPQQKPDAILAYYMFNDWWTRPAFCDSFTQIPDRTNLVVLKSGESYTAFLALPGTDFKARFIGSSDDEQLAVALSSYRSGYIKIEEDFFLSVTDADPYRCLERLMKEAARRAGIAIRSEKPYPEMFNQIGWCSWDAFYQDITEDKVVDKMKEIQEKKIPFGWILLDDGWLDQKDFRLRKMSADPEKFPGNLLSAVEKIKEMTDAKKVGVWHAFSGYWSGTEENSELFDQQKANLMQTVQGKWIPVPDRKKAYAFFADWYQYLAKQGIDFVKVDSQSTMLTHYKGNTAIGKTGIELHNALDHAAADYMNGNLINCMGMGVENVLARPFSALSRNSDDFFPMRENGFEEHLLQNAYNSLYHTVLYHGDWDMFWSSHPDAEKHAVIRALSGGPIYVSDKIGESNPEILSHLCYKDGTILRADNPAVPTKDCLFLDPAKSGYLKIKNECNGVYYLAVFNYSEKSVEVPYQLGDVVDCKDASDQKYAVYGRCGETFETIDISVKRICKLDVKGYELYMIAPIQKGCAVFGLKDKYLASHALKEVNYGKDSVDIRLKEGGELLIYNEDSSIQVTVNKTVFE
ncbi:MAG: hypothetical protein J5983_03480 [Ruminococcus sp.]|nr:hypothetical protein [Ruminococcus sp.]